MDSNKLNRKTILILLMVISSICLGSIQINQQEKESETKDTSGIEPKPAATSANLAAWIIVAGDREDHEHITLIKYGCDRVYEALINRGFAADDICYLGPIYGGMTPYQQYYSLRSNIQWAIEEWAPTRGVGSAKGLGLYIFDHGGTNYLCNPGTDLTDSNLNTYLDNLEASTGCNRIVLIYEACHAGSFINPVSKSNRIIVTSTDSAHNAHGNAAGNWAVFSEAFWSSILQCRTIGEAFSAGYDQVLIDGYYYIQKPWIDDNHDEIGNEPGPMGSLPNGGDGGDALNRWIGTGINCPETTLVYFPLSMFVKATTISKKMWVVVDTDALIEKVLVRIIPPDWTPPEAVTDDESTILAIDTDSLVQELTDPDGDGNFTADVYVARYPDFWDDKGDYKVNFYARSSDGTVAETKSSKITLNDDGEAPTDTLLPTISILTPSQNAYLRGVININATGDDNQALDKIQIFLDGVLLKEENMPPYQPYPQVICSLNASEYSDGRHNITAVAIDKANNFNATSVFVNFRDQTIPGYEIPALFVGSLLGIIVIVNYLCKKGFKRLEIDS